MKLIGVEEHFLTPEVDAAWGRIGLAKRDPSVGTDPAAVQQRIRELGEGRIALMDETGLDVQVLSLTTPALHDLGPDSVDLAVRTNDVAAEVIARCPDRFEALATLPVAVPEAAARELLRPLLSTLSPRPHAGRRSEGSRQKPEG